MIRRRDIKVIPKHWKVRKSFSKRWLKGRGEKSATDFFRGDIHNKMVKKNEYSRDFCVLCIQAWINIHILQHFQE